MIKVKICGITNLEDAKMAVELGADMLGFVFTKSPRQITPQKAKKIIENISPFILTVGVFVNEKIEKIEKIVRYCKLNLVQLHGDENLEYCKKVKEFVKVIKAFRIKNFLDLGKLRKYDVDAYLLDTYTPGVYGGTGKTFDWDLAVKARKVLRDRFLILSGGLNPRNVAIAVKKIRPDAVDVSTGVESFPGKKDKILMKKFIYNLSTMSTL